MSYMLDEIHQQPDIIGKLVECEREAAAALTAEISGRNIDFVVIAARGTSDHAAVYGKYLFEIENHYQVALADPSIFTLYSARLKLDRALVIGVSQSGESVDVAQYIEESRKAGALTLGHNQRSRFDSVQSFRTHHSLPRRQRIRRGGNQDLHIDARRHLFAQRISL